MPLTTLEIQIIRALQNDLPDTLTPYAAIAHELGIEEKLLLEKIQEFQENGILRRLGGVVRHHRMGYTHNVMVVWQVPEHLMEATGHHMAAQREISHCYERPPFPNWPFNLFTMVHGTSKEACSAFVAKMAQETGLQRYQTLTSLRELKKTSMTYFSE